MFDFAEKYYSKKYSDLQGADPILKRGGML